MNKEQQENAMSQIIAKCWADESFKQRLLAEPMATLKEEGVEFPEVIVIHALENTDQVYHFVIPAKPTDLSDDDLVNVAGGACGSSWHGKGSPKQ